MNVSLNISIFHGSTALVGQGLLIVEASWSHAIRHTTLGGTPLDEWSACLRDLFLTTHNTHNRQTSMPPAGFEPAIPASEGPQIHALHRAATGIPFAKYINRKLLIQSHIFYSLKWFTCITVYISETRSHANYKFQNTDWWDAVFCLGFNTFLRK